MVQSAKARITARKRKRKVRLGGRLRPIKPKKPKEIPIEEADVKPSANAKIRLRLKSIKNRTKRPKPRPRPKPQKPPTPKGRKIDIGIRIGGATQVVSVPQSVRGAFEEGTEALVDSTIIHFMLYEPESRKLYIQLTAAGEWRDYTYFSVSIRQFEAFRDAPSKGRHFNRNIRNTQKWGFHHNFSRGRQL